MPAFYCIDCKKKISYGHKRCSDCIKNFQQDENGGNWKGGISKKYCIDCGKILAFYYAKRCKSCAHKGNLNSHFGKTASNSKYILYKNIYFHSGWEANFAKWCDGSGIKWRYESKTFDLDSTSYTPDFYLPEFDCYIEIKGFWYDYAIKKFKLFKEKFSKINIKILDKKKLKELNIINKSG